MIQMLKLPFSSNADVLFYGIVQMVTFQY